MGRGLTFIQRLENSPSKTGSDVTGPYHPLEQQVNYDPETGQIQQIYQQPTGATDAIAMQHDVDYGVCSNRNEKYGENEKNCKHKADKKMGGLSTQFRENKDSGDMRQQGTQLI